MYICFSSWPPLLHTVGQYSLQEYTDTFLLDHWWQNWSNRACFGSTGFCPSAARRHRYKLNCVPQTQSIDIMNLLVHYLKAKLLPPVYIYILVQNFPGQWMHDCFTFLLAARKYWQLIGIPRAISSYRLMRTCGMPSPNLYPQRTILHLYAL